MTQPSCSVCGRFIAEHDLWNLLEPTFRLMCYRFGLMQLHRRIRAPHLHQQINRIGVLQRFADKANNNSHERTTSKEA